jgi:hypothetical protein
MKFPLSSLFLFVFMSACISYDNKDFEFNKEDLCMLGPYKAGDTVIFTSDRNDRDTMLVIAIDSERVETHGGFGAPKPANSKSVVITHLPIDHWTGSVTEVNKPTKITHQSLITISKDPVNKSIRYTIEYRNFAADFNLAPAGFHRDTLQIHGQKIFDYYLIRTDYPDRAVSPGDIVLVYWTKKYGLTAYTDRAGETWKINEH